MHRTVELASVSWTAAVLWKDGRTRETEGCLGGEIVTIRSLIRRVIEVGSARSLGVRRSEFQMPASQGSKSESSGGLMPKRKVAAIAKIVRSTRASTGSSEDGR